MQQAQTVPIALDEVLLLANLRELDSGGLCRPDNRFIICIKLLMGNIYFKCTYYDKYKWDC